MKRLLSILLAVMMVMSLGMTAVYAEDTSLDDVKLPFTDVKNTWYTDAIKYVYKNLLMNGKSDTTFEPESELTRAEFAKALWSLAGKTETTPDLKFVDTQNKQWYAESVTWAVNAGIVNGYNENGKNYFKPNDQIKRQEMAKMIVTFLEFMKVEIKGEDVKDSFSDAKSFQKWAVPFIDAVRVSGLMNGKEGGAFQPMATAKRSECATILMRMHPTFDNNPKNVMTKAVDAFLDKAVCAVHNEIITRFNYGSSLTPESLAAVLLEGIGLDSSAYTLKADDEGFNSLKNDFGGQGRGYGAGANLIFTLTHNESGESIEFSAHVCTIKLYAPGVEDGEVRFFAADPPVVAYGACHEEYKSLQAKKDAEGYIENLKKDATITIEKLANVNAETIWHEINNRLGIDETRFELVLKEADINAIAAQAPKSGFATINYDVQVIVRSLSKEDEPADVKVPLTFNVGYQDSNPGVCDIVTEAQEVTPGAIKLDGTLGDTEYTYLDTYVEEIELRDKASGSATDAIQAMVDTAKVGFAWDRVNGLHIAVQWKDINRNQTCDSSTGGDGMLFSGTSLNLFMSEKADLSGDNVIYYAIGKNTTTGEYAGGSYSGQGGLGDVLLGEKAPVPAVDYVISYGDDNMVTVEWTVPAAAITADGLKADSDLYLTLVLLGKNDSGFYGISFGNGGCFQEGGATKKQMTVTLKGNDEAYETEYNRMNVVLEKFLNSSTCIHDGQFPFMFTYGGSLTDAALLQVVSETINDIATEIAKENASPALKKGAYDAQYYVTLDGDLNASGYQALKDSFNSDWSAGCASKVSFILHTTQSDVVIPFTINVSIQKHFSMLDYYCKDGDYADTSWDDAGTNRDEGYTDAMGVNGKPVYAPFYCSDNYNTISVDKKMQPVLAEGFDGLKDANGTVVVPVTDLASHTAKARTTYATIWHTLNDLLDYDYPEYYFVLAADDVKTLIDNGGEGKLRVKLVPSASWEPLKKASWVEYNFKFVQKDVETISAEWQENALCAVHTQVEMYANYGSSWRNKDAIVAAVVADMGLNTTTHKLEAISISENYSNNGCGNHSGDGDDGTFKLTELATGASTEFTVHFSIMKYFDECGDNKLADLEEGIRDNRQFPVTVRHNCPDDQIEGVAKPEEFELLVGLLSKTDANGFLTIDLGGQLTADKFFAKLESMLPAYNTLNYVLQVNVDANFKNTVKTGKGIITFTARHISKWEWTMSVDIPVILK